MKFIGRLTTQLYYLLDGAHSEGAKFAVPCAWRPMSLLLMSILTLNYECQLYIAVLAIPCPMGGSRGDVSEEPVT